MFKKQFNQIFSILSNPKFDWTHRYDALQKISQVIQSNQNCPIIQQINKNFNLFNNQILDLRSKISNKACQLIMQCVKIYKTQFQIICDKLISKQSLIKLLSNGNKVLAEYGNQTIKCILSNCQTQKYLPKLFLQFIQTKNIYVKEEVSSYIQNIVCSFQEYIINNNFNNFQKVIAYGIINSSAKVRKNIRNTFYCLRSKFPKKSQILMKKFQPSVLKIIQQQYKAYQQTFRKSRRQTFGRIIHQSSNSSQQKSFSKNKNILKDTKKNINNRMTNNYCYSQFHNSIDKGRQKTIRSIERSIQTKSRKESKTINQNWKAQDIDFLLLNTQNQNWSTRLTSFQKIYVILEKLIKNQGNENEKIIQKIVHKFVHHLQDTHIKIVLYVVQCLELIIKNNQNLCVKYAQSIMKRCIKGIAQSKQKQQIIFITVLQLIKLFYSHSIFLVLIQHIEQSKNHKQKSLALDFAIQILQQDVEVVEIKNLNYIIKTMANLIYDYFKDKNISIPALALISILKQYQSMNVLVCLRSLNSNILNKIIELAGQIQPQLEESIIRYMQSTKQQCINNKKNNNKKQQRSNYDFYLNNKELSNDWINLLFEKIKQGDISKLNDLQKVIKRDNITKLSFLKIFNIFTYLKKQQNIVYLNTILQQLSSQYNQTYIQAISTKIKQGPHIEIFLRRLNNIINNSTKDQLEQSKNLIINSLLTQVRSKQAQVRRLCIITFADYSIITNNCNYYNQLNSNEQRLVQLYIQRRKKHRK